MTAPVTLWVRAAYEGPQILDDETDALGACFVSAEDAGIGETGVLRVVVRGPLPADHAGIPIQLYAARVFNEFGCDVWTEAPVACACDEAGCDVCRNGVGTSTGRPGIVTESLSEDFFYPASGGP